LWFNIDQRSSTPIYQQLVEGVKEAVAKGVLSPGDRMPSVRELATRIAINPNTIAKAYQELEREAVIETLRGRGTFVSTCGNQMGIEEKKKKIAPMLNRILVEAYHMQMEEQEMLSLMEETVREWYRERRQR